MVGRWAGSETEKASETQEFRNFSLGQKGKVVGGGKSSVRGRDSQGLKAG